MRNVFWKISPRNPQAACFEDNLDKGSGVGSCAKWPRAPSVPCGLTGSQPSPGMVQGTLGLILFLQIFAGCGQGEDRVHGGTPLPALPSCPCTLYCTPPVPCSCPHLTPPSAGGRLQGCWDRLCVPNLPQGLEGPAQRGCCVSVNSVNTVTVLCSWQLQSVWFLRNF